MEPRFPNWRLEPCRPETVRRANNLAMLHQLASIRLDRTFQWQLHRLEPKQQQYGPDASPHMANLHSICQR